LFTVNATLRTGTVVDRKKCRKTPAIADENEVAEILCGTAGYAS
jgi:hypothetical protein